MNIWIPLEIGVTMGLVMSFAVLALAAAYRLFDFPDLTIEGSFLFGAVGFAILNKFGIGPVGSIAGALVLGAAAGATTGFLHARFRINKFLTGILVTAIAYSLSLRLMSGPNLGLLGASTALDNVLMNWIPVHVGMGKIVALLLLSVVVGFGLVALMSSRQGLRWRVAGCNSHYAKNLGIGLVTSSMLALACTNLMAAFSGALLAVHQGFVDIGLGQGMLIIALASMSIGDRLLSERSLSIPLFVVVSSLIGSITYQVVVAYAVSAGLNPVDLKLITALLVLAVIVTRRKRSDDPLTEAS